MVDCKRTSRKRHQFIAGADVIPWITRHDIHSVFILEIELLGRVLKAIIEACAACACGQFLFICLYKMIGVCLFSGSREDD